MRPALKSLSVSLFAAALVLVSSACATTGPSASGPTAERMRNPVPSRATIEFIGYEQAVALASGYALGTGNLLRVVRAEREGGTWTVDVDVQGLLAPRRTELELDASTGELLQLRTLPVDAPGAADDVPKR